ncbi:unnamed protein product, partial [Brachionus calyciflorus]
QPIIDAEKKCQDILLKGSFTTANGQPLEGMGKVKPKLKIGMNEVELDVFITNDNICLIDNLVNNNYCPSQDLDLTLIEEENIQPVLGKPSQQPSLYENVFEGQEAIRIDSVPLLTNVKEKQFRKCQGIT